MSQFISPWQKLLERPYARVHFVQLYDPDGSSLAANVSYYISEGLKCGDGALVVATPEHQGPFCGEFREKTPEDQLLVVDAQTTLAGVMKNGRPDWDRFVQTVGSALARVRPRNKSGGIRVYGEMVGLLWKAHQFSAAVRLEQFWNRLMARSKFSLFCGYSLDVFEPELHNTGLDQVLCAHSHLVPSAPNGSLKSALWQAIDEVLGDKSHEIRNLSFKSRQPSWVVVPEAEAMVRWLTKNIPNQMQSIAERARRHYHDMAVMSA